MIQKNDVSLNLQLLGEKKINIYDANIFLEKGKVGIK